VNRRTVASAVAALAILVVSMALALHLHRAAPAQEEGDAKPEGTPEAVEVRTGIVETTGSTAAIDVTGTLQALPGGRSRVAAQASGRLVSVLVRPGDTVRAGQLLAVVSRADLAAAVRQAAAGVREAEREVEALGSEYEASVRSLPLEEKKAVAELKGAESHAALVRAGSRAEEIERAEAALKAEQADLERLRAGARPQEIAQAEAAVRDASAARQALQKDLARKRTLYERGIAAGKEVERAEADLATAQATLDTRQQALALLRAGNRPEEIRVQENKVKEAEAQLRQVRAGARPQEIAEAEAAEMAARAAVEQVTQSRERLRSRERRLAAARERVAAAREQARAAFETASRTDIRSPLAGVVTQVLVAPGDGVAEQSPVVEVMNRDALRAVLDVSPTQRTLIRPGISAELAVSGLPGVKLTGSVRTVLAQANPETGLLPVEVWVSDPQHRLAEGMSVRARIPAAAAGPSGRRPTVPTGALFSREGDQFVYVVANGEAHERKVETGREQGERTEVLSGLRAGERIILDGSLSLADGTPVKAAP
jgi:HlyD family secretion protein